MPIYALKLPALALSFYQVRPAPAEKGPTSSIVSATPALIEIVSPALSQPAFLAPRDTMPEVGRPALPARISARPVMQTAVVSA